MAGRTPHRDEHTASEEQPRGDAGAFPNASSSDEEDEPVYTDIIFEGKHIVVREHYNGGTVAVEVADSTPTLVQAADLRDALNEYLDGSETAVENDSQLTVEVDADVSSASDAIESLQTDMEALTEELNEAVERVEDINLSDTDFGVPAPSPSDVQAEMEQTDDHAERSSASHSTPSETNDRETVPVEPLYELAEMWAGVRVHAPHGDESARTYRQARQESGEWLKEELDELTGETDE